MTLDNDVALLRELPIFADFSAEQLRLIAFSAEPLSLPEETVLFREGAAADGGYVIVEGAVRLTVAGPDGPLEKGIAGPGALLGELALVCPTRRPATATTIAPTSVMAVSRRLLKRVLQEYPDMAVRIRASLARRLGETNAHLAHARRNLLALDGFETEDV